uniref:Protein F16 n=1 Tax=Strongyloides papillosus TaxID=174720 RepID=A0A0N5BZD3_STREA
MTFEIPCSVIRKALDSNEAFLQIKDVFLGASSITKCVALIARKENILVILRKSSEKDITEKTKKINNSNKFEKEDYETKLHLNMASKAISTIYDSTFNKSSLTKICVAGLTDRELEVLHDAAMNSYTYSIKFDDDLRNSLSKFTDLTNKSVRLFKCPLTSDYLTNLSTSIWISHKNTKTSFTTFNIE